MAARDDKRSPDLLEVPDAKKLHLSPVRRKDSSPDPVVREIVRTTKPYARQDTPTYQDHQNAEVLEAMRLSDIVKLHTSSSSESERGKELRKLHPNEQSSEEIIRRGLKYDADSDNEIRRLKPMGSVGSDDGRSDRSDGEGTGNKREIGSRQEESLPYHHRRKRRKSVDDPSRLRREQAVETPPEVYGTELGCLPLDSSEWRSVLRGFMAELLGTTFFMVFLVGALSSAAYAHNSAQSHLQIALVAGFAMAALSYVLGPASGANLNPAVSLMLACCKKITALRALVYVAAQCAGAIIGAKLAQIVNPEGFLLAENAINQRGNFSLQQALGAEILGTAFLIFVMCSVFDSNNNLPDRANAKQSMGVLAIGMGYFVPHVFLLPITLCAINPARALGTSVVADSFPDHWLFWVGPAIGSLVAVVLYECVIKDRPKVE